MDSDKPILYRDVIVRSQSHHWLCLLVPIPHTNLYQIYQKNITGKTEPGNEWVALEYPLHLYEKAQAIERIQGRGWEYERVDRLTALTLYGMVVEE
jgi:hypothetical protein